MLQVIIIGEILNRKITQEKEKTIEENRTLWQTRCYCLHVTVYVTNFYTLFPIFQVWINKRKFSNQKVGRYTVKSFRQIH